MKPKKYNSILVIGLNYIGDVLMTTPLLQNLRNAFPSASITLATGEKGYAIVNKSQMFDKHVIIKGNTKEKLLAIRKLGISFDLAVVINTSFEAALLSYLLKIPVRVGLKKEFRSFLLTKSVRFMKDKHHIQNYLNILQLINLQSSFILPMVEYSEEDIISFKDKMNQYQIDFEKKITVINPGTTRIEKRWNTKSYGKVADQVSEKWKHEIVITGSEKDIKICDEIESYLDRNVKNLCGKLNLTELYLLLRHTTLMLTSDTGPMHIGCAAKNPYVIALFGQTNPILTGPYGNKYHIINKNLFCSPCYKECKYNYECMKAITVDDVLKIIDHVLS